MHETLLKLIVFLPLFGALVVLCNLGRLSDKWAGYATSGSLLLSALLTVNAFIAHNHHPDTVVIPLLNWIDVAGFHANWALRFDTLSLVMLGVVTIVSSMVHVYSIGYMHDDKSFARFMAYLSLFTFFMCMLVTADNLVQMFFGWEGVGLASYLLIGFWNEKDSANAAAMKAFIVNRVGDLGFALGIFLVFHLFGTVSFDAMFAGAPALKAHVMPLLGYQIHSLSLVCFLLFIGAMGKSAQLGLHTWLPDAMEGPTPVSALIHAATMVTAGVFMVARLSPIFELAPDILSVITVIGACTAIFAATVGLVQNDIKKVIAYSTCSQLGYMFFAAGVSAYPAAIFHLATHAFFKALLFLSAGSVIHAVSGEQDLRKMGNLWKNLPYTYAMIWIGSLALGGIPFFAGYYSKDTILEATFMSNGHFAHFAYWIGITAAFLTCFYSFRLLMMTFHGESKLDHHAKEHLHESPWIMLVPLFVLAAGAIFSGYLGYEYFVGGLSNDFWHGSIYIAPEHDVLKKIEEIPTTMKELPLWVALSGIFVSIAIYGWLPKIPALVAKIFKPVYILFLNKWFFDELYNAVFVIPARFMGRLFWKRGDEKTIDAFGPNGIATNIRRLSSQISFAQTGYIYHYTLAMMFGLIALLSVLFWTLVS